MAEILITLGIIGVVSAMVIPTLIENARNRDMQVRLKKVYSEWNQVSKRFMDDHEESISSFANTNNDMLGMINELNKYFTSTSMKRTNVLPYTKKYSLNNILLTSVTQPCDDSWTIQNFNIGGTFYQFDGIFPGSGAAKNGPRMCVDLNGPDKMPNTLGIDIFSFVFTIDGAVIPEGQYHPDSRYGSGWSVGGTIRASADYCKPGTTAESTLACAYYALNDINPAGAGTYWKDFIGKKLYKNTGSK
ncbi:MAG: hypothetical protein NC191_06590 [Muribaculaceae bacterium]|nr:hypothetical protein [Muribaculaceae bacterium]